MQRRDFIKLSGCFIAGLASASVMTACRSGNDTVTGIFTEGVASGDPRPDSIMLWTRARPAYATNRDVGLTLQIAQQPDFRSVILERELIAPASSDYTCRILVQDLQPGTFYYYRFTSGSELSTTGRTRTAPDQSSMDPVNLAFVSCQERKHGFYTAYRRLIEDDLAATEPEQLHFVLHLGDFIYETRNDPLQQPVDDELEILTNDLLDAQGNPRTLDPFDQGGVSSAGIEYANSVDDYRALYRQYLADPDLQAARARWPFIPVWDDHEFSDDCWQTEANYEDAGPDSSTDEPSQPRKVAANQAWFEYMPVNLTAPDHADPSLHHAHDFQFADVGTTPNTLINRDNLVLNEDNIDAINSLTIYRSLQFGSLMQLIVTDNRSYRSDHAIPEDLTGNIDLFINPRVALPLDLQNDLDAGSTANGGNPDTFLLLGSLVLNPRRLSPPGTMLGQRQKTWFKQTVQQSTTRWKLWANSVPLMRLMLNLSALSNDLQDILLSVDTWDGYRTERNELMTFLLANDIQNVVSLSGDLHAHFAGQVVDDFDLDTSMQRTAMVEAVCGAVSSISQFTAVERLSRRDQYSTSEALLRKMITYDSSQSSNPGNNARVNNLNNSLLNGTVAARVAADTNDLQQVEASKDPQHNPHLKYADTRTQGYGIARIDTDQINIELVTLDNINQHDTSAAVNKRVANLVIPYSEPGQDPGISEPVFEGDPPFPFAHE